MRPGFMNRVLAAMVGFFLVVLAVAAPVRESVITVMLLFGLILLFAAVAGEVQITVRTNGGAKSDLKIGSETIEGVTERVKNFGKAAAKMAAPRKAPEVGNPGKPKPTKSDSKAPSRRAI